MESGGLLKARSSVQKRLRCISLGLEIPPGSKSQPRCWMWLETSIGGRMVSSISLTRILTTSLDGGSDVDYMFNELSFHGQFRSAHDFHAALETVMEIRRQITRF